MNNEPDKWQTQTWIIPGVSGLVRRGHVWRIEGMQGGFSIPLDANTAEHLAEAITSYQEYHSRKYRRSFRFKWIRFWYLRKHRQ